MGSRCNDLPEICPICKQKYYIPLKSTWAYKYCFGKKIEYYCSRQCMKKATEFTTKYITVR